MGDMHGMMALLAAKKRGGQRAWASWDELSELTLKDVSFVCLFENTSAGGNETAVSPDGTISSLTVTQSGTVAGATGSPPSRAMDGSNDKFYTSVEALETILVGSGRAFSLMWKVSDVTDRSKYFCMLQDAASNNWIYLRIQSDGKLSLYFESNNSIQVNGTATSGAIPTTGDVYLFLESTGSAIRFGFSTTKPTDYASVTSANKSSTSATPNVTDISDTYILSQFGPSDNIKCNAKFFVARGGANILT